MRVTEYDEAADGGFIVEIDDRGQTFYVHRTHAGKWVIMDCQFRRCEVGNRQALIDLAAEHEVR